MDYLKEYLPQSVSGKKILITGGSTGIGRAAAVLLSAVGAKVIIVGRDENHLADALNDIRSKAQKESSAWGIIADLSTEEGIQEVFGLVDRQFSGLDVLINNAALAAGTTQEGNYKEWQEVVNTNLTAYIACCSEAVKRMGGEGHIINVGSMSADVREETGSVYVATKSGIQGFSEAFRKQVNSKGIKVTLIEPGAVDTDMQPQSAKEKIEKVNALEMLSADDIAVSILYCLSQPKRCDVVDLKIRPHLQII
ncbi:SDR family oxidoreductase [Flavobacterium sp. DG1-102-2]|uniref:SDR family oxidoreductase n=1 Tax=Flavobacterium sp. DG1-102-2 TaxID=3081663 RepID=UPI0029490D78|nr:SDR family oxidoreductase [Flavobacterium sp. DG1-102-2]MDV6167138.1 SDR family oxidoreductase [Flavobacterium sp. DG1-102-2]